MGFNTFSPMVSGFVVSHFGDVNSRVGQAKKKRHLSVDFAVVQLNRQMFLFFPSKLPVCPSSACESVHCAKSFWHSFQFLCCK